MIRRISGVFAKAQGLKRYFTGRPCGRGHVAERFVADGRCVARIATSTCVRSRYTSSVIARTEPIIHSDKKSRYFSRCSKDFL